MAAPERGGSRHPRQTHPALRDGSSGRPVGHHASDGKSRINRPSSFPRLCLHSMHLSGRSLLAIQIPKRPGGTESAGLEFLCVQSKPLINWSRDCFTEAKDADNLDYEEIFTFGKNGSDI